MRAGYSDKISRVSCVNMDRRRMLFEEGTEKMFNTYALEQRIASHMGAVGAPGAAVAVISGAEIVYARGFGVTSVEDGAPVTPHTLFCIGSTISPTSPSCR